MKSTDLRHYSFSLALSPAGKYERYALAVAFEPPFWHRDDLYDRESSVLLQGLVHDVPISRQELFSHRFNHLNRNDAVESAIERGW